MKGVYGKFVKNARKRIQKIVWSITFSSLLRVIPISTENFFQMNIVRLKKIFDAPLFYCTHILTEFLVKGVEIQ